jgi:predicted ATP-grasp superfamily ATP-dependent carboligase
MRQDAPGDNSRITVADIPRIGMTIGKDEPVCTLLTKQQSITDCHSQLNAGAEALLTLIDRTSG